MFKPLLLIRFVADRIFTSVRHVPITVEYPYVMKAWVPLARTRLRNYIPDCMSCLACEKLCPVAAIEIESEEIPKGEHPKTTAGVPFEKILTGYKVDYGRCTSCGICVAVCPTSCLTFDKIPMAPQGDFQQLTVDLIHTPRSMRRDDKI